MSAGPVRMRRGSGCLFRGLGVVEVCWCGGWAAGTRGACRAAPNAQGFSFLIELGCGFVDRVVMILPQVHLRKPCYDFTFL